MMHREPYRSLVARIIGIGFVLAVALALWGGGLWLAVRAIR